MPRPVPEFERRHQLESLRLASELAQFATCSLAPALKEHIERMAKVWADQAAGLPPRATQNVSPPD
jgi:hypothetical protein